MAQAEKACASLIFLCFYFVGKLGLAGEWTFTTKLLIMHGTRENGTS